MSPPPGRPTLYHITHGRNLAGILAEGCIWSDAELAEHPTTLGRFAQVSRLIEGFESPYGLELLATVHWVADRQGAQTLDQAVEQVHGWSQRKTMFTPHQIKAAWDRLHALKWLGEGTAAGVIITPMPPGLRM